MCVTDTVGLGYYSLVKCLEEPQMKGKLGEGRLIRDMYIPKKNPKTQTGIFFVVAVIRRESLSDLGQLLFLCW